MTYWWVTWAGREAAAAVTEGLQEDCRSWAWPKWAKEVEGEPKFLSLPVHEVSFGFDASGGHLVGRRRKPQQERGAVPLQAACLQELWMGLISREERERSSSAWKRLNHLVSIILTPRKPDGTLPT